MNFLELNYFAMNEPSNYVAKKQILATADVKIFWQGEWAKWHK